MRAIFIIIVSFFCLKSYAQSDYQELSVGQTDMSPHFYEENGKMGLKKNSRKHLTPAIYDTLINLSDDSYVGKRFSTNKQQALWGLLSNAGEIILPFKFFTCEVVEPYIVLGTAENNRLRKGLYDFAGRKIISNRYENIQVTNNHIIGRNGNINNVFTIEGVKLKEYRADSIELLGNKYVTIYQDGKAGMEALDNSITLPAQYEAIKIDDEEILGKRFPKWMLINGYDTVEFHRQNISVWGDLIIASSGSKSQVVNRNKKKISSTYDKIIPVSSRLAKVKNKNRWGVIDSNGKEIIPVNYSLVLADKEFIGARAVSNVSKWSVFDKYGFLKTKLIYDSIKTMSEGRIPVKRNERWGYLDRYGVEIITPIFEEAYSFNNDRAHVRFFGESGIIDRRGKWIIPPIKHNILDFNPQVILTRLNGQYQVLSYEDELIYFTRNTLVLVPNGIEEYDSTNSFIRKISWEGTILNDIYSGESVRTGGSGLTIFKENGRFGFKDQLGRIIIANRYEEVKPFHQGMAAIKIRNRWGFIDRDEIIRVQPRYDSVGHFIDGSCLVKKGALNGVIDINGNELISPAYDGVIRLSNNTYRVSINNKWGLIGENGEIIIHPKYDLLETTDQGYFIVKRNNQYGSISTTGVNEIPLLYDYIAFERNSKTLLIKEASKEKWAFIMKTHIAN